LHRKNGFAEIFKNLIIYRSENNFVGSLKQLYKAIKMIARILSKLFTALLITFEILITLKKFLVENGRIRRSPVGLKL